MKLLNGNLYLESKDCADAGLDVKMLTEAKAKGRKSYTFINDPDDNRKWLLEYESLKADKKEKVRRRFGDPYEHLAKEPIRKMVTKDLKAEAFYLAYRYEGSKMLPIETVQKYTAAASWLNVLVNAEVDKKTIKKLLNLSLADFWVKVCEIIESDGIDLPTSYKRLREKIKDYEANGYPSLIHGMYGKAHAKKVSDELAESLLLELISQPYHDDAVICRRYNEWATNNNRKTITPATVGVWRRANEFQIMASKQGTKEWYNTFGKQIMRSRPSAPLLLLNSDDNSLDLYFQSTITNKKGHTVVNYFNRFVLIVVMDAFNDYILGYAIGETVTADLVKLAYLDALHHIHDLTGGWYLPYQLQTDRWGMSSLEEFYKSICKVFTPATAKVARAKYIEQAFGVRWHQELRRYPNYAGNNVTAQTRLNEDHLQARKGDFPSTDMAPRQIAQFINTMRLLVDEKTGLTRQQQWLTAFQNSPKSQELPISELQLLQLFGRRHEHTNRVTNRGLTPAINCVERTYEIPDEFYLDTVGKSVQVIYDPLDYSRILVEAGSLRFIAREYEKMPSAIADYKPGDRARLNARLEEKKRHVEIISQKKEDRLAVLQKHRLDAEGLLQAGVLIKELKQQAELTYQQSTLGAADYDPLDDM